MEDRQIDIGEFALEEGASDHEPDIAGIISGLQQTINEQAREIRRLGLLLDGASEEEVQRRLDITTFELNAHIRIADGSPLVGFKWGPQLVDLPLKDAIEHAHAILRIACVAEIEARLFQFFVSVTNHESTAGSLILQFRKFRETLKR